MEGLSIKEFVLAKTLGEEDADEDLAKLEAFLDQRIARPRSKGVNVRTVAGIFRRGRGGGRWPSGA